MNSTAKASRMPSVIFTRPPKPQFIQFHDEAALRGYSHRMCNSSSTAQPRGTASARGNHRVIMRNLARPRAASVLISIMWLLTIASIAAGLFAGAAIYISVVEHPARASCGTEVAIEEFAPSYRRATVMQASLAIVGGACGLVAGWQQRDIVVVIGALLVAGVVPFTLLVIAPTNRQLLDSTLDRRGLRAAVLLKRWARLHAVRSIMSSVGFCTLLVRLAGN